MAVIKNPATVRTPRPRTIRSQISGINSNGTGLRRWEKFRSGPVEKDDSLMAIRHCEHVKCGICDGKLTNDHRFIVICRIGSLIAFTVVEG